MSMTLQTTDYSWTGVEGIRYPASPSFSIRADRETSITAIEVALRRLGSQADWLVDYYGDATSTSANDVLASVIGLFARPVEAAPPTSSQIVLEIHDRSGLTWEQIARALGVSKRAALMWARGAQVSAANLDNLAGLRTVVNEFAGSTADETRVRLISSRNGSISPLAAWVESRVERASKPNAPTLDAAALMG